MFCAVCAHVNYTQIFHHIVSIPVEISVFLFINIFITQSEMIVPWRPSHHWNGENFKIGSFNRTFLFRIFCAHQSISIMNIFKQIFRVSNNRTLLPLDLYVFLPFLTEKKKKWIFLGVTVLLHGIEVGERTTNNSIMRGIESMFQLDFCRTI